jgi:hypothetical protein
MIKRFVPIVIAVLFIVSCGHKGERPTTAIDTGRTFIRETLDGDYDAAQTLLFQDSLNTQFFDLAKMQYERSTDADKKNYRDADYTINKYTDVNDSTEIINYSNSYMKKPLEIKVIRKENLWQIDFKYTVSGNSDSN